MLREIFWKSFVGLLVLAYGAIQLWQTFVPMFPSKWGFKKFNLQWYVWVIFFLIILIFYIIAQTYRLAAHRFELAIDLKFGTSLPRENYGRYLGVSFHNNSPKDIEACIVKIIDVQPVDNEETNWKPSHLIKRHDAFRWSDWMSPSDYASTFGKLDIKSGHEAVANILFTEPKKVNKNVITLDLQSKDYRVDMPKGLYIIH